MTLTTAFRSIRTYVTVLVTVPAAAAGLVATAPAASAQGNCYHYGHAGYAQLFTDSHYNGDCFEIPLNTGWQTIPGYASRKVSSFRSWGWFGGEQLQLGDSLYGGSLNVYAGTWVPAIGGDWNDRADIVKFN